MKYITIKHSPTSKVNKVYHKIRDKALTDNFGIKFKFTECGLSYIVSIPNDPLFIFNHDVYKNEPSDKKMCKKCKAKRNE